LSQCWYIRTQSRGLNHIVNFHRVDINLDAKPCLYLFHISSSRSRALTIVHNIDWRSIPLTCFDRRSRTLTLFNGRASLILRISCTPKHILELVSDKFQIFDIFRSTYRLILQVIKTFTLKVSLLGFSSVLPANPIIPIIAIIKLQIVCYVLNVLRKFPMLT
jgi:hypothetical protein